MKHFNFERKNRKLLSKKIKFPPFIGGKSKLEGEFELLYQNKREKIIIVVWDMSNMRYSR